jgi:small subunit ribosomal protein S7
MEQKNKLFMSKFFTHDILFTSNLESSSIFKKLLQSILKKGQKKKAQKVLLNVISLVQNAYPEVSKDLIFVQAIKNIQPSFEFKKARVGGMNQFIPGAKKPQKQENLAIRWILTLAKEKQRKTKILKTKQYSFEYFLSQEILLAFKNESDLKQKKLEIHKLAETNRALAYQRWW